jgi:glutaconate CoA-transferase subunit A
MPSPVPLGEAIAAHVHDGDTVALEGFTHLIPFAAAHEIARQGRRHLTLVRMTPDLVYDQLIGLGVADELVFSYGGNPGVGSLHRLRDAVEKHWPHRLVVHEHSHAGLANAYVAGAARLPFAVLRGYRGTDLEEQLDIISRVTCPFTGEELAAVKAVNPDVAVIHAQVADREGNVMLWGITGVQREAVLAAKRAIVTVEEVVDEFPERTGAVVLPNWVLSAVSVVPGGAWPSYAAGYSVRDNDFYKQWDAVSRDRAAFLAWARENGLPAADPGDHPQHGEREVGARV